MDGKTKAAADLACSLIRRVNERHDMDALKILIVVLSDMRVSIPMTVSMEATDMEKFLHAKVGDTVTTGGPILMKPDMLKNSAGELFFPVFTLKEEAPEDYRSAFSWITMDFMNCVHNAYGNENCDGVVINGFSESFVVNRPLLQLMIEFEETKRKKKIDSGD